ncbi:MAG: Ran-binding protein 9 [Trizodia sp. TS-e1964]|nr:MAG: Ran-binding protein 9 [Trizodia sp. TS-e1964]
MDKQLSAKAHRSSEVVKLPNAVSLQCTAAMSDTLPQGSPGAPAPSSPTASSSNVMPRRSSYAAVVSGMPPVPLHHTGRTHHHYLHPSFGPPITERPPPQDADMSLGQSQFGQSPWSLIGQPPLLSRLKTLGAQLGSNSYLSGSYKFFAPSYLLDTRFIEQLSEAHRAKLYAKSQRQTQKPSSSLGTLSSNASTSNLPKSTPSNRGMTFDIVERELPHDTDGVGSLPSRWSKTAKSPGLEISGNGFDVRFVGQQKSHGELEAAAVLADHPMPPQCGLYYFEVLIRSKGKEGFIGIGFSGPKVALTRLPGWEPDSWAYHGDDGKSFCCQVQGKEYGPQFTNEDYVGCGVNFRTKTAFFTKNGYNLGIAFRDIKGVLFPSVGMKRNGEHVTCNFGHTPFVFDIDGMMKEEKLKVQDLVNRQSIREISGSLDEHNFMQELIAEYLYQEGFTETAKAFHSEVKTGAEALGNLGAAYTLADRADATTLHRQTIRTSIINGDIDLALELLEEHFPSVLNENHMMHFRLKCRKFIDMVFHWADMKHLRKKELDENVEHAMDIDDSGESADDAISQLFNEYIAYGKQLFIDHHQGTEEEKKLLIDTAFILSEDDPKTSEIGHLFSPSLRIGLSEDVNSLILVSIGKPPQSAISRMVQQTQALLDLSLEEGGPAAFVNLRSELFKD